MQTLYVLRIALLTACSFLFIGCGSGDANTTDSTTSPITQQYPDTDGDGIADNIDNDDDGDNVIDSEDEFPLDASESLDTDGDGIGNNADNDDDGDNVIDSEDAFPLDANESLDTDGDGVGDNSDEFPQDNSRASPFTTINSIHDGLLERAESIALSADEHFMFIGNKDKLTTIALDANGQLTNDITEYGQNDIFAGTITYINTSITKEHLYVSGQLTIDNEITWGMAVFAINNATGALTHLQSIPFNNDSYAEMFLLSPDGKHLYALTPYGSSQSFINVFTIELSSGQLTFSSEVEWYSTGDSYEQNFTISQDGQFIYYGYSSSGEAAITAFERNTTNGSLSHFFDRNLAEEYGNDEFGNVNLVALKASNNSNELVLLTGDWLLTFTINQGFVNAGSLSLTNSFRYNNDNLWPTMLDFNDQRILVATQDVKNNNSNILYFELLNGEYQLQSRSEDYHAHFVNVRLSEINKVGYALALDDDEVVAIDYTTSSPTSIVNNFGHTNIEKLTPLFVSNTSFIGATASIGLHRGFELVEIKEQNNQLTSNFDTAIELFPNQPIRSQYLPLTNNKIMTISYGNSYHANFHHYSGVTNQLTKLATQQLTAGQTIYKSFISPNEKSVLFYGRGASGYSFFYYSLDVQNNQLTFIAEYSVEEYGFSSSLLVNVLFIDNQALITNDFGNTHLVFELNNSEMVLTNNLNNDLSPNAILMANKKFMVNIGAFGEDSKIESYSTSSLMSTGNSLLLDGTWSIVPSLRENEFVAFSDTLEGEVAVRLYQLNQIGQFNELSRSNIVLPKTTTSGVATQLTPASDNNNVFWLQVLDGYFDTLKISIE